MSGGSWDYFFHHIDEVADRLAGQECPHRRALSDHMRLISKALHDIEWVDSGDWSGGDEIEAIKDVFGTDADKKAMAVLLSDANKLIMQLRAFGAEE